MIFLESMRMVKNVEERIARIKQQREALAQRLNTLEQKSKSEARKRDTRRKIIVGGAIIAQMEKDTGFAATVRQILAAAVGRQNDREAIADLLNAAPGVASAAAPEKSGGAPAPPTRECARHGCGNAGRALNLSPAASAPRSSAPPFPRGNSARTARRSSRFRYRQSFPPAWTKKRIGARRRATF